MFPSSRPDALRAVDRDFVVRVLTDLVRINSVNSRLVPDGPGEAEVAAYIDRALQGLGLDTARFEPCPGRVTAVGWLRGTGQGRSLMLNGHSDTVGVEGMSAPFSGEVREGRVFGRGAHDMKGSLAAMLAAVKVLVDSRVTLGGDVVVAAVADEEFESLGTTDLLTRVRTDGAIVTEPTNLGVCLAHKGFAWVRVETTGRAAHGSRFDEGIDANLRMGRVLGGVAALEERLRRGTAHALVGPPSLHAAVLRGGSGLSTYSERCCLDIERRTVPGESQAVAVGEIEEILAGLRLANPGFEARCELLFGRDPWATSADTPVVRAVTAAASEALGGEPRFVGESPWMDAALIAAAGTDTVVVGPTGAGEHAAEEWVDIESVVRLAALLAGAAVRYCARTGETA